MNDNSGLQLRGELVAQLETHLLQNHERKRSICLLGSGGMGKTTILNQIATTCCARQFLAITPRMLSIGLSANELLTAIVDALSRIENGSINSPIPSAGEPTMRRAISLLETVAVKIPTLLLLDDFHNVGPDAVESLTVLIRATSAPVAMALGAREERLLPHHTSIFDSMPDFEVCAARLTAISQSDLQSLAISLLGKPILESSLALLLDRTGGNPLFVKETLRAWDTTGALLEVGGHFAADLDRLPSQVLTLSQLIRSRFGKLSLEELQVLQALAISTCGDLGELAHALEMPLTQLDRCLQRLSATGLVQLDDRGVHAISHPLIREEAVAISSPVVRSAYHERNFDYWVRRHLEGSRTIDVDEIAEHGLGALTQPTSLRQILELAARSAVERKDSHSAARWYSELRQLVPADDDAYLKSLMGEAEARLAIDPTDSLRLFEDGSRRAGADRDKARFLVGQAKAHRMIGDSWTALSNLQEALAITPADETFRVNHAIAIMHAIQGDRDAAEASFSALAIDASSDNEYAMAIGHLAQVRVCSGAVATGHALCVEALEHCTNHEYQLFLRANLGWYAVLLGDFTLAETTLADTIYETRLQGDLWNLSAALSSYAKLQCLQGYVERALDRAVSAGQLSTTRQNAAARIDTSATLAWILLEHGEPERARTIFGDLDRGELENLEPRELSFALVAWAECELLNGAIGSAQELHRMGRDQLFAALFWAESVDRLEAQILLAEGNPARAFDVLGRWLEEPGPVIWEHARLLEIAAQTLLKIGKRQDAIARVDEAIAIYEQLGAPLRLDRAMRWRAANYRRPPGRPRSSAPAGITPRERDVLDLVIRGKTNREIAQALVLSTLTVNKHLENIMMKAGVSRRTELVGFAERLGLRDASDRLTSTGV